jgi:hypothetical protein
MLAAFAAWARGGQGVDPHHAGADCRTCHNAEATALKSATLAHPALRDDLETQCFKCHADQGPSHKTNIAPKKPPPASLPLSPDNKITCYTCHWMHGEPQAHQFEDFERIDNRRGALCLSCHEISELSQ